MVAMMIIQEILQLIKSIVLLVGAALSCGLLLILWLMVFALVAIWELVHSPLFLYRVLSIKWQSAKKQQ